MRASLGAFLLAAALVGLAPVQAAEDVAIKLLSPDPTAGDHTMTVRVTGYEVSANATRPDARMLLFALDTFQCRVGCEDPNDDFDGDLIDNSEDNCPTIANAAQKNPSGTNFTRLGQEDADLDGRGDDCEPVGTVTDQLSHRFVGLRVGDIVRAEIVFHNGSSLNPPVYVERIARNVLDVAPGPRIAITSPPPNAGDYRMSVRVTNLTQVAPGSGLPNDRGEGHLRYLVDGQLCTGACAGSSAATLETSFTYRGVQAGQVLTVEIVNNDGTSRVPPVKASVVVVVPSILALSSGPRAPEYTMQVEVRGFTLVKPGGDNNAGTGHVKYLLKRADAESFETVKATAATSYTFTGLEPGDTVAAELVHNDGKSLSPAVRITQEVGKGDPQDPFAPGVGPVLAIGLLAAAAVVRWRRRAD